MRIKGIEVTFYAGFRGSYNARAPRGNTGIISPVRVTLQPTCDRKTAAGRPVEQRLMSCRVKVRQCWERHMEQLDSSGLRRHAE